MQYIDNDMDELFRKAGENYPLRTDGADWDALQAKLADSTSDAAAYTPKKFNRNYLWLLLLLFVPLIMVINKSDNQTIAGRQGDLKDIVAAEKSITTKTAPGNKKIISGEIKNNLLSEPAEDRNSVSINNNSKISKGDILATDSKAANTLREGRFAPSANGVGVTRGINRSLSDLQIQKNIKAGRKPKSKNNIDNIRIVDQSAKNEHQPSADQSQSNSLADTYSSITNTNTELIPVDSTTALRQPKQTDSVSINKQAAAVVNKKQPVKIKDNKKGFYFGVIGGPDISTIKAQKVTNTGYSVGAVLGYSINKHWSVEAGALWDEKKYYTRGEYFDKTGTSIPQSVTVHYLDGTCNMFEFPIAIRYDLNMKKNSFFITAGLTSYVMKKESYNYGADNNGNYYEGFKTYKNSGDHLFSNLQLTAGYNYHLSPKLSLRIEPYIKIPVRDIGIGKMPISSKGIYVGITRRIR